jgi:predicted molibdopterin-dependent oxidoreductase YjgC
LPGAIVLDEDSAARFSSIWGFPIDDTPGLTAPQMIDAAGRGDLDVLFSVGGNFLEVMPDPGFTRMAMGKVGLRVHMDIVMSSQMLVEGSDTVLLLPAATRYETPGGVTDLDRTTRDL